MISNLCQLLDWDTSCFGKRIGRIVPTTITKDDIAAAIDWAGAKKIDCLYFLCDIRDLESARLAAEYGFSLTDIRIKKEIFLSSRLTYRKCFEVDKIELVKPEDIPVLKLIARESHADSRFYTDRNFDPRKCAELYEHWLEKSCNGWAKAVLVARLNDETLGYASCHEASNDSGSIGLMAVASQARSRGLGTALLYGALTWFQEHNIQKVTVVTQGRNIAAQRLYERSGFLTQAVQLWYHRWTSMAASLSIVGDTRAAQGVGW